MIDAEAQRVGDAFRAAFGRAPDLLVRAPGRVNLIGEHTDYNDGFVLPCAIDRATTVAIGRTAGSTAQLVAADYGGARDSFGVNKPIGHRSDLPWAGHVRGIFAVFRARGLVLGGADIAMGGNVPQGSGLSSSASLSVALGKALAVVHGHALTPTDLALMAQAAENDFVGVACGNMDQLVSANAMAGHALLIDCRSLAGTPVPIPADAAVLVIASGVVRQLLGSEYNDRRRQCEAAAQHYGVQALRDLDVAGLDAGRVGLDDSTYRRARHVVTENARTLETAVALKVGDLQRLGELFAASHASMRDDFEITVPAVDRLAAIAAAACGGEGGARMTGGGFGGCVVAVTRRNRATHVVAEVLASYRTPAGEAPMILDCVPSAGVAIL